MNSTSDTTIGHSGAESLTGPLSSLEISERRTVDAPDNHVLSDITTRPLALRQLRPGPASAAPDHRYDPVMQVTVQGDDAVPVEPELKKEWTTIEGTHTDGDGGDNEMWEWEEK